MKAFRPTKRPALFLIIFFASASAAGYASATEDPLLILKKMTDFIAAQQSFSAVVDTDIEVITSDLQKIQFASSGKISMSRPDKLRLERNGGYANVELIFDGKTATVLGKNLASSPSSRRPVVPTSSSTCCAASTGWTHRGPICS